MEVHVANAPRAMMRFPLFSAPAWVSPVFLFSVFASVGFADVRFTEPSAGANLTAGEISVQWEESGVSPPISELTQYTLSLMVGGNDDSDMVCSPYPNSQAGY